jgi:hypothetical protein
MDIENKIDLVAQVLLFSGFIFGVIKYSMEKKKDFQRRFFEEQLKVYSEAVDCAAIIPLYDKTEAEYKKAIINFRRLYWGKMCIVEDKKVEAAMFKFNLLLDQYDKENDKTENILINKNIQKAGLTLAHACRNSCLNTWGINTDFKGYNDYTLDTDKI